MTARVAEMSTLRYTPAGIPVLDLILEHESQQMDTGHIRQVKLYLSGLAFGLVAETLLKQTIGKTLQLTGFLSQGRSKKSIRLHIQEFKQVDDSSDNQTNSP